MRAKIVSVPQCENTQKKTMFQNPKLYEHLKDATKEASDLLQDIKTGQINPEGHQIININNMIESLTAFKSCVHYLMESKDIKRLYEIDEQEERRKEIKETILRHIKKYLGCPHLEELFKPI